MLPLQRGKGVIFLAIHSGSWELASVVGGVTKGPIMWWPMTSPNCPN